MSRSVRKAIAFITFLAMAIQTFVFSDVTPVSADETKFIVSDWGSLNEIENPTENVTIPADTGADYISLWLYDSGIKSLTIKGEYSSIYISADSDIEELVIPKDISSVTLVGLSGVKSLKIGNGCDSLYLSGLASLTTLTLPDSLSRLSLNETTGLKSLKLNKGLEAYRQVWCPDLKVTIPATVSELSCDDYSLITIDKNNPYYEIYDGSLYDADKFLVTAADKPTLNIKEGTLGIRAEALCGAYAITTINMPDSLLYLDNFALAEGYNVKKLKVSKNLISIQSYAFSGLAADTIKLPSTLEYVDTAAFNGYYGTVSIDGDYS
ncbi:MAG: leucine-rich repeat protein, partial [Lachnospiraceae bacterium]|nr:leucine-rich repeat protein [Lachnospiraceae bacterium]